MAQSGKPEGVANELACCERLLAEIVRLERESEQDLVRRRDESALRLAGAHTASRAHGAYLGQRRPASGHLNLTSGE